MALVLKDRVKETSTTTGTGAFTLAGAVTGYQSFSAVGDGNTTYYCIAGQTTNEWEVGVGTYTASGTSLSRDTILASSNSNSIVTFSAGTKDVFVVYPAGKSVNQDASGVTTIASLVATTADINGGTIDGTAIGGSTPAAGAFTTLSATGKITGTSAGGDYAVRAVRSAGDTFAILPQAAGSGSTLLGLNAAESDYEPVALWSESFSVQARTGVATVSQVALFNSTGLAVTGTLSSTGNFTVNTNVAVLTAAAPANSLYLNGSGNLGLGTTTPSTKLHLLDTGPVYIQMTDAGDGASRIGQNGTALTFGVDGADGSTERMRIDASGNVGIGTASPGVKLDVQGAVGEVLVKSTTGTNYAALNINNTGGNFYAGINNSAGNAFSTAAYAAVLWHTGNYPIAFATNNSEKMRIDSSGNVGIGTASPGNKLVVEGTADTSVTQIIAASGGDVLQIQPSTAGNGARLRAVNNAQSDFEPLSFVGEFVAVSTRTGVGTSTERMRIDSSGNVGIGTTSPSTALSFPIGASQYVGQTASATHSAGNVGSIGFGISDGGGQMGVFIHNTHNGSFSSQDIRFLTHQGGVSAGERMRIDASGNVGIGTASPGYKLQITNSTAIDTEAGVTNSAGLSRFGTRGSGNAFAGAFTAGKGFELWAAGSQAAFIDASGNVGIGTASPGTRLDVYDTTAVFRLTSSTGTNYVLSTLQNTGGALRVGAEGSSGGSLLTGSSAYSGIVGTTGAYPLAFGTNAAERMRIDSSGNVGIGTATPSVYGKLGVAGNIAAFAGSGVTTITSGSGYGGVTAYDLSGAYYTISTSRASDGVVIERFRIDSSGNVGIGTASPLGKLHLRGAGTTNNLLFYTDLAAGRIALEAIRDNIALDCAMEYYAREGGAHIWFNGSYTERMRIDSSGNVGIGTTTNTNSSRVYIEQAGNLRMLQLTSTNADSNVGIGLTNDARAWSVGVRGDQSDSFNIRDITASADRLNIDSSGNVGINTTSPGSTLDVKGTLRLSGSTSGYVGLAPAAAAGSTTYTLPSADGTSGQSLTTNGSGTLSWASPSTSSVLSAIAGMSLGAVGTHAFLYNGSGFTAGSTYSGANLSYSGVLNDSGLAIYTGGSNPSGTWMALGSTGASGTQFVTLCVRTV